MQGTSKNMEKKEEASNSLPVEKETPQHVAQPQKPSNASKEGYITYYTIPTYNPSGPPPTPNRARVEGLGSLHVLSDNFLAKIFKLLPDNDFCRLSSVSRAFYFLSEDEYAWKRRALARFKGGFLYKESWKRTCMLPRDCPDRPPLVRPAFAEYFSEGINYSWYRAMVDMSLFKNLPYQYIERRDNLSLKEFIEKYDSKCIPVIVTDVVPKWKAATEWTKEGFVKRFGTRKLKTDEVCNGKKIKMNVTDYFLYHDRNQDEDPIYLFDPGFDERAPELLEEYEVPQYFKEDLFSVLGENKRPLYRWVAIGPERSGSPFHVDPYKTSAWNGLLKGRKRWLLYPPNVVPPGVDEEVDSDGEKDYDAPEPMKYFVHHYPVIPADRRPYECMLEEGEMIFVPTGWWHMVLNVTDTICVTQNFMNSSNFWEVYDDVKKDDPKMRRKFKRNLQAMKPEVYNKFFPRDPKKRAEKEALSLGSNLPPPSNGYH